MRLMKQMAPVLVAGLLFLSASAFADKADKPVSISTLGRALIAPIGRSANVVLIVRTEKHPDNRKLEVLCEGFDGGALVSSERSFDEGEKQQQKIYDIGFSLPPATYRCQAILKRKEENGKMREFKDSLELTIR